MSPLGRLPLGLGSFTIRPSEFFEARLVSAAEWALYFPIGRGGCSRSCPRSYPVLVCACVSVLASVCVAAVARQRAESERQPGVPVCYRNAPGAYRTGSHVSPFVSLRQAFVAPTWERRRVAGG